MLRPIRLVLRRSAAAFLLLLLTSSVFVAADEVSALATTPPAQCKRLIDADSEFVSALSILGNVGSDASAFKLLANPGVLAPIDATLPSFSKCVAATNPLDLLATLSVSSPKAAQCLQEFTKLQQTNWSQLTGPTLFADVMCPKFDILAPCITDVLLPVVEAALSNTNGCCDELLSEINVAFGAPLKPTLTKLIQVMGNAVCSKRTLTSAESSAKPDVCGDSLLNNWYPYLDTGKGADATSDKKAFWSTVNTFQIPNDQACKASRSQPFDTTMKVSQEFGYPNVTPYGSCYLPMDALQQYVRALPLWNVLGMGSIVQTVYGDARCLDGKDFVTWAMTENGALIQATRIVDSFVGVFALATSGASPTPSMTPAPASTPEPTPAPSSGSSNGTAAVGGGDDNDDGSGDSTDVFDDAKWTFGDDGDLFPTSVPMPDSTPSKKRSLEEDDKAMSVSEIVRTLVWQISMVKEQICFHIPNGVQCTFPGELLTVPYPEVSATTDAPTQPPQTGTNVNGAPTNAPPANNGGSATGSTTGASNSTTGAQSAAVAVGSSVWWTVAASALTALVAHAL